MRSRLYAGVGDAKRRRDRLRDIKIITAVYEAMRTGGRVEIAK
ncbi:MAG: hypothetical protein ACXWV8_07670 [Chitinophagaceae bacterium]